MHSLLSKVLAIFLFAILAVLLVINAPDAQAATANTVVISEVSIGKAGAATDEFVELYNPTANPVSLNNWKLTRKVTSGTESTLVSTISGTIPSHGYFLIANQGYTGSTSADQIYTDNSITSENTVILYAADGTTVVDKVGFGDAVDSEGTAETDPAAGTSRERRANATSNTASMAIGGVDEFAGNGEDTNNNASDFVLRNIPQPQNSTSVEPAPTGTPTATPSVTVTATPTATTTPTMTPTPTVTATPTPTMTPTPTATPTPTTTPTVTPTPTTTVTPTATPTVTPTATPTVTPTATPSVTPTMTVTPSVTSTPTPSITMTPTPTPVATFPTFKLVCTNKILSFNILSIHFSVPLLTCNVVKL